MEERPFNPLLLTRVDDLELSLRSANCLKSNNIVYVGDLVQKTAEELLQTPNFGPRSLSEINMMLAAMDLHLGTEVQGWPPSDPVLVNKVDGLKP
jgi:DNA-directed RNA polymerase subunit alpha